ncbi:hypothetical protein [Arthrobacter terrae]|nr:hypothetical protein [Arthrobacter terrae]
MTETPETSSAPSFDLAALEATASAAAKLAPGNWFWRGNTDHEEPSLNCIVPSLGRVEILGHVPIDRVADSFEARQHLREFKDTFMVTDDEAERHMADWLWADQAYDLPNTDSRLSVTDERNVKQPVRDLAVYEVARHRGLPDDTPRTHEGIYRGNIVDVRNPIAQHLAAASADTVLAMVERIRELEKQVQLVSEAAVYLDDLIGETYGGGPTNDDYVREAERLASLSFASGAVKAALNGVRPYDYVGSEQADKDVRQPFRCYVLSSTSANPESDSEVSR